MPFVRGKYVYDVRDYNYGDEVLADVFNAVHDYLEQHGLSVSPMTAVNGKVPKWFVSQSIITGDKYVFDPSLPEYFDSVFEAYAAAFQWIPKLKRIEAHGEAQA